MYEDINGMLLQLYKAAEYASFGLDIDGNPDPTLRQEEVNEGAEALETMKKYIKIESVPD